MEKTRSIDWSQLSLRDALDLAILVEEEAKDRYDEFVDQMELHHNDEAVRFFRFMRHNEEKHERQLAERRVKLHGDAPRAVRREMLFDVEAPEYDEVRGFMTVREALETALRAEQKAHAFFVAALEKMPATTDPEVRALFAELRDEEIEHEALVRKELARLSPDGKWKTEDFADEPVSQ